MFFWDTVYMQLSCSTTLFLVNFLRERRCPVLYGTIQIPHCDCVWLFSYFELHESITQGRGVERESGSFLRETPTSGTYCSLIVHWALYWCGFGRCIVYSSCRFCYLKRVVLSCHFVAAHIPVVWAAILNHTISMSYCTCCI